MLDEHQKKKIIEDAENKIRRDREARGAIMSAWVVINTIRQGNLGNRPIRAWLEQGVTALVEASVPIQYAPPEVVADWVVASNCLNVLALIHRERL